MDKTVSGLGGAFIFSDQPERLAGWFEDCFGLSFENWVIQVPDTRPSGHLTPIIRNVV